MTSQKYVMDSRLGSMLNLIRGQLSDSNKVITEYHNNSSKSDSKYIVSIGSATLEPNNPINHNQVYEDHTSDPADEYNLSTVTIKDLTCKQALKNIGVIKKLNDSIIKNQNDCCAICIQNFKTNEFVRILKCHHQFHKKCVDKWLYIQFCADDELLCPLCQQNIDSLT